MTSTHPGPATDETVPTPPREAGGRWLGPVALAAAGAVVVAVVLIAQLRDQGWDYVAYLDAARRLVDGEALYQAVTQLGPFQPGPPGLYLYPPPLAVALMPVAHLSTDLTTFGWAALHIVALVVACLAMPTRPSVRAAALLVGALTYPVIDDTRLGNVSVLVLCLASLSWRWLGRPMSSVALALSMAIRPTQGVVLIGWLLRRSWRPIVWTCLTGLVLVLVTLPVVGPTGWEAYLRVLRNLGGAMGVAFDFSLGSVALRAGAPRAVAELVQLAGYGVGVAALLLSLRRDAATTFHVAIGASLLLSPLLWVHYLALVLLPAAFLAHRGRVWPLAMLAPLTWLPTLLGQGELVYPLLAIAATLGPLTVSQAPSGAGDVARDELVLDGHTSHAPMDERDPHEIP